MIIFAILNATTYVLSFIITEKVCATFLFPRKKQNGVLLLLALVVFLVII